MNYSKALARFHLARTLAILAFLSEALLPSLFAASRSIAFSCAPENDLYQTVGKPQNLPRFDEPSKAVEAAPEGSALLILADGYPTARVSIGQEVYDLAARKNLRVYVEYPSSVPGVTLGAPKETLWERLVVSTDQFGPPLPKMQILVAHQCLYLPAAAESPWLVVAKVAGYNSAVYGLPKDAQPILFQLKPNVLVATTKLSNFITGRFAPHEEWKVLWKNILHWLAPENSFDLDWTPLVRAAFPQGEPLTRELQQSCFNAAVGWFNKSGLMPSAESWARVEAELKKGEEVSRDGGPQWSGGDGTYGILEGFASQILPTGHQRLRWPIRADCQAESAMVFAVDWLLRQNPESKKVATNLLHFLYFKSEMHGGARGNPEHPAFGLISWGGIAPAWQVANYGDDNARTMLATMMAAACLETDQWDFSLLKALVANLRTTGKLGFRGDRIDMGPLEKNGWKHYHDAATVNYSPHFEAYSWACFLWAYQHTQQREFLEKSKIAMKMTMDAFPNKWRWNDNMERSHMLLGLSWLARIENTEEHREWVQRVAYDLMKGQNALGALPESFREPGGGHYHTPRSNEDYGTSETPLLQKNGDPVSDQLYTAGFALLGLHEAALALGDAKIAEAADKLAGYLCRIQNRSEKLPYLDGTWFRAFDFQRWEAWASSGDLGWGAWSIEAGWAQAWGAAIIGLRLQNVSFWDLTSKTAIAKQWPAVQELMARNTGQPWTKKPGPAPGASAK